MDDFLFIFVQTPAQNMFEKKKNLVSFFCDYLLFTTFQLNTMEHDGIRWQRVESTKHTCANSIKAVNEWNNMQKAKSFARRIRNFDVWLYVCSVVSCNYSFYLLYSVHFPLRECHIASHLFTSNSKQYVVPLNIVSF